MLRFLFGGLTKQPKPAQALFNRLVEEARRPHWFVEGQVPDTLDGRFAMLATILALAIVRLEQGAAGLQTSAALTERFVEAMDSEHRQMGLNDPGLGKRVRKLVGSLARRTGDWREAVSKSADWTIITESSVYRNAGPDQLAIVRTADELRDLWRRLTSATDEQLAGGQF
jgi:cytochrome b pre-mRNA-processing protein 3